MRSLPVAFVAVALVAAGCAHHKANQYAYAPPLAPPVYPQPQTAAQPVVPVATAAPPGVAVAPAMPMAMPVVASADPCCPPLDGVVVGVPVVHESPEQTPPCPPAP